MEYGQVNQSVGLQVDCAIKLTVAERVKQCIDRKYHLSMEHNELSRELGNLTAKLSEMRNRIEKNDAELHAIVQEFDNECKLLL